jgi:hypothetical protein
MPRRSLGFALAVRALVRASCVSPEETSPRERGDVRRVRISPALTPSLVVPRRRAWLDVTGRAASSVLGLGLLGRGSRTGCRIGLKRGNFDTR